MKFLIECVCVQCQILGISKHSSSTQTINHNSSYKVTSQHEPNKIKHNDQMKHIHQMTLTSSTKSSDMKHTKFCHTHCSDHTHWAGHIHYFWPHTYPCSSQQKALVTQKRQFLGLYNQNKFFLDGALIFSFCWQGSSSPLQLAASSLESFSQVVGPQMHLLFYLPHSQLVDPNRDSC